MCVKSPGPPELMPTWIGLITVCNHGVHWYGVLLTIRLTNLNCKRLSGYTQSLLLQQEDDQVQFLNLQSQQFSAPP